MAVDYNYKGPRIVANGLITYFDAQNRISFNSNNTTSIKDVSKGANDANFFNIPYNDTHLEFNGTNSYLRVPSSSSVYNLQEYTYLAWIKTPVIQIRQSSIDAYLIFSRWGSSSGLLTNISFNIQTSKKLLFRLSDGITRFSVYSNTALSDETWYYVGVSFKGPLMKIYINGVLDNVLDTGISTISTNGADLNIGRFDFNWSGYAHYYEGLMNSIHIYDRELTESEILTNYNATKGRFGL